MNKIKRILGPVDLSEASARAFEYAQSLAHHYGATLIAQHVVELWQHPCAFHAASAKVFDEFREQLLAAGRESLNQFLSRHRADGLRPECVVQEGSAGDAILSAAQADSIDLIVMGTHGRRGLDRAFLGSVVEHVLRNAHCPVLVVRNIQSLEHDAAQCRRILCCIDFSNNSERVLEYARSLAETYKAEVTVLHVLDEIKSPGEIARETTRAMAKIEGLISVAAFHAITVHLAVRLGNAHEQILEFASDAESDLIVTGIRGRRALAFGGFGSTTYRVIQRSCCPVLAVHLQEDPRITVQDEREARVNEHSILQA